MIENQNKTVRTTSSRLAWEAAEDWAPDDDEDDNDLQKACLCVAVVAERCRIRVHILQQNRLINQATLRESPLSGGGEYQHCIGNTL